MASASPPEKQEIMRYCCYFNLFLIFQLLSARAARAISSSSMSTLTEWRSARATYYAAQNPPDSVGGACGYGNLEKAGYGSATAGLSEELFDRGRVCGACFEIRCAEDVKWCIRGGSVIVTATNFCPPNYGLPADAGGHCNPPNRHFVIHIEAFQKIATWKASNIPVQYRRYLTTLFSIANMRPQNFKNTHWVWGYFLQFYIWPPDRNFVLHNGPFSVPTTQHLGVG